MHRGMPDTGLVLTTTGVILILVIGRRASRDATPAGPGPPPATA